MKNTLPARTGSVESLEPRRLFSVISVAPVEVVASDMGTSATFTAVVNVPSPEPIKLFYTTVSGTAKAGRDYKQTSGSITLPANATTGQFTIKVLPNTVTESNKVFYVNLRTNNGNAVANPQTNVTIIENSVIPTVVLSDSIGTVGRHRVATTKLFVGLSNRTASPVTVQYDTQDVTAVAGEDYIPVSGTLTIPAYKTYATIPLKLIGTAIVQPDAVFDLDVTGATNAVAPSGLFSREIIKQNDPTHAIVRPNLTISSPTAVGGNSLNFVLTLSAASQFPVSFRYTTQTIDAQSNQFTPVSGVLTIPAGQTTTTITVPTTSNLSSGVNVDKTVRVAISSLANAQLATSDPVGTLLAYPTISISDVLLDESGTSPLQPAVFFVTLNQPSPIPVSVTYNTANGNGDPTITNAAAAGIDYVASSGTITFAPGQTSKSFSVTTLSDKTAVGSLIYTVNLSGAVNGVVGRQTGTATLSNIAGSFGTPMISVDNAAVTGDNGDPTITLAQSTTGYLDFTISLGAPASVPVTVSYTTKPGTGAAGTDYVAVSGTVTFSPGQTNINVPVKVFGNSPVAVTRTVLLVLSNPVNGVIATGLGTGTGTITDTGANLVPDVAPNLPPKN